MKNNLIWCGVIVLLLSTCAYSQEQTRRRLPVKGNVYYTVSSDRSRVSLLFKGDVQHTEIREGKNLTIHFSGIDEAASHGASNLSLKDGIVRRVALDRIENGRTNVVLTLRNGTENYAITKDVAQGMMRIDVFHNPFAVITRVAARSVAPGRQVQPGTDEHEVLPTPDNQTQSAPIVDLSVLVRTQMEEAVTEKSSQSVTNVPSHPSGAMAPKSAVGTAGMALAIVGTSMVITLVTIILLVRGALRRNARITSHESLLKMQPRYPAGEDEFAHSTEPRNSSQSALGNRTFDRLSEVDSFEGDSTTVALAEQYRRSQGDIELAMKIREQTPATKADAKVGIIKAIRLPKKGKVRMARKNGIGTGEVDLASKLSRLQDAFSEREAS
jgi:hypothetical protein